MQERYPYLAYWKRLGLNEFPTVPPKILYKRYIESPERAFLEGLRKKGDPLAYVLEKEIMAACAPIIEEAKRIILDKMQDEMDSYRKRVQNTIERVMKGEIREEVKDDLARELLPETKGGGTALTENRKRILKAVYLEMQDCIKEVRRSFGVPLKNVSEFDGWKDEEGFTIKEWIPEITTIFADEELPLLTAKPSVAETAAEIILVRLRRYSPLFQISRRRFQDILAKVRPF